MSEQAQDESDSSTRRRAFRLAIAVLVFLFVFTHRGILGQNDLSRFVAVSSLVNRGVLHIDDSPWAQQRERRAGGTYYMLNDMVCNPVDGHLYSSKPPVFTLILAGVLKPFQWAGAELAFYPLYRAAKPAFLLTWLVVGTMSAAAFYAFRRQLGRQVQGLEGDMVTLLALGGTLFLAYSTTMNHHTFTAALILFSFFLLGMPQARPRVPGRRVALAGLLMGLATVVDIGHGFMFGVAFALYILCYMRSIRGLVLYGLGALGPLALHCAVQYATFESILPVQWIKGTKDYAGSYWHNPVPPDTWQIPRYKYWLLTLFSSRGLFVLSPILLVGVAALARALGKGWRGWHTPRDEQSGPAYVALTVLLGIGLLVFYHGLRAPTNFCGACFGMRWYIGFSPLLSYYAARSYARCRETPRLRAIFLVLGLISLCYALIGMQNPWTLMETNPHPAVQFLRLFRGF